MSVITSYSIHYTKLYDPLAELTYLTEQVSRYGDFSLRAETGRIQELDTLASGFNVMLDVITSYSIHYTKLYEHQAWKPVACETSRRGSSAPPPK